MTLSARNLLRHEAESLLARLGTVQLFGLHMPMTAAAAPSSQVIAAIDSHLSRQRRDLEQLGQALIIWLDSSDGKSSTASVAQARLAKYRLRVNAMLTEVDIYSDVLTQRSEHVHGIWLSALDATAQDMLARYRKYFEAPPVLCYLDRGHGAAIRRWATRLPGGSRAPVAVLRVPRERMVSTGVASSLAHEVGHQAAALMNLVQTARASLEQFQGARDPIIDPWRFFTRWRSEILADLWSVGQVGICQTVGLMAVVTLPPPAVFHGGISNPHPIPWIRVLISAAIGDALFPHPQWALLARAWRELYPLASATARQQKLLAALEKELPKLAATLVELKPQVLRGASLKSILSTPSKQPDALLQTYASWKQQPKLLAQARPSEVFAVLGQARAMAQINPTTETRILLEQFPHWAMRQVLVPETRVPSPALTRLSSVAA